MSKNYKGNEKNRDAINKDKDIFCVRLNTGRYEIQ